MQRAQLAALRETPVANVIPAHYKSVGFDVQPPATSVWKEPGPQSGGAEWIYDVFTPPEIYYNATTKQFTVTPPNEKPVVHVEPPFGVRLVQVNEDVFRLQLVGYVGNGETALGTFQNMVTGETLLANAVTNSDTNAGKSLAKLGLTIRGFKVERRVIHMANSMPIYETVATAVVMDEKTGEEVTLTNKKRSIKGPPIATFAALDGQTFEKKAGGAFKVGSVTYSVGAISVQPASAVVTKTSPDLKSPIIQTLTPEASPAPAPASTSVTPTTTPSSSTDSAMPGTSTPGA